MKHSTAFLDSNKASDKLSLKILKREWESPLFQPEDRSKRSAEENTLHTSESNDSFREGTVTVHPLEGPISLLLYTWQGLYRVKQMFFLSCIL